MARSLKVYRAHIGFFDTVVAAHSQKDALAAWGGAPAELRQGFASVTNDPAAVTAALRHPGIALYRLFGTSGPFSTERTLPKTLPESLSKAPERDVRKAVPKKAAGADAAQHKAELAKGARAKAKNDKDEKEKARAEEQRRVREEKQRLAHERRRAQEEAREELDRTLEEIDREERALKRRRAEARAAYDAALAKLRDRI